MEPITLHEVERIMSILNLGSATISSFHTPSPLLSKAFTDDMLDLVVSTPTTTERVVDNLGKQELPRKAGACAPRPRRAGVCVCVVVHGVKEGRSHNNLFLSIFFHSAQICLAFYSPSRKRFAYMITLFVLCVCVCVCFLLFFF